MRTSRPPRVRTQDKNLEAPDAERCPCSGITLDRLLQPAILTVLSRENLHGYKVGKYLAEMRMFCNRKPDLTGLYRALKDMERRELIVSSAVPSEDGPDTRVFRITPNGQACLKRWTRTLEDYRGALGDLLNRAQKAIGKDASLLPLKPGKK
jgi:DNA-binding PadR family transcriptional regulator